MALDTAAAVPWEVLEPVARASDLVLLDIKAFDSNLHYRLTGVYNDLILENARRLAKAKIRMRIRLIVVPGENDDDVDLTARLEFIHSLGSEVEQTDILPYHRLGEGKYRHLSILYPLEGKAEASDDLVLFIQRKAQAIGLRATISG